MVYNNDRSKCLCSRVHNPKNSNIYVSINNQKAHSFRTKFYDQLNVSNLYYDGNGRRKSVSLLKILKNKVSKDTEIQFFPS